MTSLCPIEESGQREVCDGDHKMAKRILEAAGFDSDDLKDMFAVLRAEGACCDCEVLYNVAESSRLKAEYWKRQQLFTQRKFALWSPCLSVSPFKTDRLRDLLST